jgi:hypothetical protein
MFLFPDAICLAHQATHSFVNVPAASQTKEVTESEASEILHPHEARMLDGHDSAHAA